MSATPLLLAAGLPGELVPIVSDGLSPWGPLAVYEDLVEAMMRLHQEPAALAVLSGDRADTLAAAERIRETAPDTVVVLLVAHGLSDRLVTHWTSRRRAQLALQAPVTRSGLRAALAPLLPAVAAPDAEALAEEAALARAVAEQAGREAEEARQDARRARRAAAETARDLAETRTRLSQASQEGAEALALARARSEELAALRAELADARAEAGRLAQELGRTEAALDAARARTDAAVSDAQEARDQQIADIQWFMGELRRLRG